MGANVTTETASPRRKRVDLKAEFVRRNLTITEVAERVGVARSHLSDVLWGRRGMTVRLARDISRATGIPLKDIEPEPEAVTA